MGHTIDVHRSVYRLHEDVVEIGKVSKLLIAIEEGNVANFKGLSLDQINVEGKSTVMKVSFYKSQSSICL